MTGLKFLRVFPLLAALLMAAPALADWMNLTGAETAPNIAEIYVMDDHVRLVLEVYIGDLDVFEELVPDDWLTQQQPQRPDAAARIKHFAEARFQFVTGAGEKLPGRIVRVEARQRVDRRSPFAGMINPLTRQRVPEAPADKRVLYAEIEYPFVGEPAELTIVPPQDDAGQPEVSLGFIVYHESVPVIDFRYLGAPATLSLDWDDPWYSKFDNPNLKRHHKSALMSFLYVEPYEVRHEILTRVRDLEAWLDLDLRGDEYIELDELEPLKQRIGDFLLTRNPVLIDGRSEKPILDRSNYVKVSLTGIQLLEVPERLQISSAIVGVIITYLTDGLPQEVTVSWDLFTDQVQQVPTTATDPAGPLPGFVTPDDNIHRWTNFLKDYRLPTVQAVQVEGSLGELRLPWISICCAVLLLVALFFLVRRRQRGGSMGVPAAAVMVLLLAAVLTWPLAGIQVTRPAGLAGDMPNEQAQALLQHLLKNVYRAFDFRDEEDVYDKLAFSVSGDLLSEIYLQNRRSFAVQKAGGAQAKVRSVDIEAATAERLEGRPLAYAIKGRWTAQGSVGHWGHIHTRQNRYDAIVTVEAEAGSWKITDMEILQEQRIDPADKAPPAPS